MWHVIASRLGARYVTYITLPIAVVVGSIGYALEKRWAKPKTIAYLDQSIADQRERRLRREVGADDPLADRLDFADEKQRLVPRSSLFVNTARIPLLQPSRRIEMGKRKNGISFRPPKPAGRGPNSQKPPQLWQVPEAPYQSDDEYTLDDNPSVDLDLTMTTETEVEPEPDLPPRPKEILKVHVQQVYRDPHMAKHKYGNGNPDYPEVVSGEACASEIEYKISLVPYESNALKEAAGIRQSAKTGRFGEGFSGADSDFSFGNRRNRRHYDSCQSLDDVASISSHSTTPGARPWGDRKQRGGERPRGGGMGTGANRQPFGGSNGAPWGRQPPHQQRQDASHISSSTPMPFSSASSVVGGSRSSTPQAPQLEQKMLAGRYARPPSAKSGVDDLTRTFGVEMRINDEDDFDDASSLHSSIFTAPVCKVRNFRR
ncbi:hypothetical protein M3Y99_01491800 [Aphelenchoides fujianensis]|nr:hypothetical protein M3Y99_01491800 [Aphelenchoides fujianensis]